MSDGRASRGRRAWLRWVLISEAMILALALAGPGSRYTLARGGEHGIIARWIGRDATYLDAVLVNVLVLHVLVAIALVAARLAASRRAGRR